MAAHVRGHLCDAPEPAGLQAYVVRLGSHCAAGDPAVTRDANSGGDVDEDVIDNRQTHRHATWGGGYWD
ncbi:hypothetical protein [Mycobacteroides chelonae]|uniref:hypothetical protein n=1 Tax=Mycobacteroides chelonae TaxID=1774 RepID=UPI0018B07BFC|nr:hypothetical protein [Mycobacteroides chelonae]MBF9519537.1 hypothetical protein [Mycobacteroides chelonae]